MNELEHLTERLAARFPTACLTIDRPDAASGGWFLDATLQGHLVVVEWRTDRGFGVSTPSEDDYGAKPDEVYRTVDAAYSRVVELLLSQTPTKPPVRATLPELRGARKLSQAELANRLSINQGACSRMERRSDMLIGTLRNVVAAMGGELYLVARFPDETVYIDLESVDTRNGSKPVDTAAA
ncbi:XRE family transcriptional regulator [Longimicrobium sp.]|uniref:XRE family transcriptional regulator n=1 Tax=Longimicrobium sp. TaxID=2029185 RepID=UPI003B3AFCE8